nr:hypothetical protein [Dehalococcoidia bacterium]
GRERHLLDLGLVPGQPGEREWLSRRAAAVHFQSDDAASGFAELMVGLRGCSGPGLDDLATDLVGTRGSVLIVGSLYTVAEAREHLLGITGDRAFGLR